MQSLFQCKVRGSIVTVGVEQISGGFIFLLECPPCHLFVIYSARVNAWAACGCCCKLQLEEAWSLSKQSHLLKNSCKPRQDLKVFSSYMWKFLSIISQYLINKLTRERIKFLPPTSAPEAYCYTSQHYPVKPVTLSVLFMVFWGQTSYINHIVKTSGLQLRTSSSVITSWMYWTGHLKSQELSFSR